MSFCHKAGRSLDLQLGSKRALVTGASAGIGTAIALALAREGVKVVVHGRDHKRTAEACRAVCAAGGVAAMVLGDLADDHEASRIAREAKDAFGGIDILVNNAGAFAAKTWFEARPEDWLHFYQTDVMSAVRLIHAIVPNMRERRWGRVIQLASGQAVQPSAVMADYSAAKAAVVNLSVSLSRELAGSGVTANTVSPGLIKTPAAWGLVLEKAANDGWGGDEQEIEKRWMTEVLKAPSGTRAGRVEEVAAVVTFLASPLADYVNGANLRVDGGKTLGI